EQRVRISSFARAVDDEMPQGIHPRVGDVGIASEVPASVEERMGISAFGGAEAEEIAEIRHGRRFVMGHTLRAIVRGGEQRPGVMPLRRAGLEVMDESARPVRSKRRMGVEIEGWVEDGVRSKPLALADREVVDRRVTVRVA